MAFSTRIGKYELGRALGEGAFSKVKIARNVETGHNFAVKIIDKQMVIRNNLMDQVIREIRAMKLARHSNIVRLYEVLASKRKIYLVMEYVGGGELSDRLAYMGKIGEEDARKYFHQLIDAVEYCHSRGVYHRDLKPHNLLLDGKGKLKVSDFGLSALHQTDALLSTSCGSPYYVAPEVMADKNYDGAAADVWSCGVVLFELLAGFCPFEDINLFDAYRKENLVTKQKHPNFINAFQLIAMSNELDLSRFFEKENESKIRRRLSSRNSTNETMEKIEAIIKTLGFLIERKNYYKMTLQSREKEGGNKRSYLSMSIEVIEVAPCICVVEIWKYVGEMEDYTNVCETLSNKLRDIHGIPKELKGFPTEVHDG